MLRRLIMVSILGLGLVAAGCGGGGEDVDITLQEFAVGADPSSVSAGSVTFNIENIGPDDTHEFVVIRTDLDPTALPTDENGAVDDGRGDGGRGRGRGHPGRRYADADHRRPHGGLVRVDLQHL